MNVCLYLYMSWDFQPVQIQLDNQSNYSCHLYFHTFELRSTHVSVHYIHQCLYNKCKRFKSVHVLIYYMYYY